MAKKKTSGKGKRSAKRVEEELLFKAEEHRLVPKHETLPKEERKALVLQVMNITGGSGGPYHVDFDNVKMFASAVVKGPTGLPSYRQLAAYVEENTHLSVLENVGLASITVHLDLPDMSALEVGQGVIGVYPESYVSIRDSEGQRWDFTALGIPVVSNMPLNQQHVEQTFAIVGAAA